MLRIQDIMTKDVTTVSPETTLRDAMELMAQAHVSGVPVVAGTKVLGVVTSADLLAFAAGTSGAPEVRDEAPEPTSDEWEEPSFNDDIPEDDMPGGGFFSEMWEDAGAEATTRFSTDRSPEWNVFDDHVVSEVMTRSLWALPPSADVREAADLMRKHAIHRVLVVDNGELVGIVSALDVASAAAEGRLTKRTFVFNRDRDFGGGAD